MGDFMMDDEFDESYDGLIRLGAILGEVKGRGTPQEVINGLPTATYKDWATDADCETRCPICLEDYVMDDPTRRLPECNHWFHRDCITQWLQTAPTCPVCRQMLKIPRTQANAHNHQRRGPHGGGAGAGRFSRFNGDLLRNWTFGPGSGVSP